MANTRSKTAKAVVSEEKKQPETIIEEPISEQEEVRPEISEQKNSVRSKRELDPNMIVTVKNGFHGILVYQSRKTQEIFRWEEFGAEQDMELSELKNAKNSAKEFFENNWFDIEDLDVLEYLGVTRYYKYALHCESFDDLFSMTPEQVEEKIAHLSEGQKKSVKYRAKQLAAENKIDSLGVLTALEKGLSTSLMPR